MNTLVSVFGNLFGLALLCGVFFCMYWASKKWYRMLIFVGGLLVLLVIVNWPALAPLFAHAQ